MRPWDGPRDVACGTENLDGCSGEEGGVILSAQSAHRGSLQMSEQKGHASQEEDVVDDLASH